MQQQVMFKSDKTDIYGMLHLPRNIGMTRQVPGVVLCHGFMGTKVEAHRLFIRLSRKLEDYRIASLRFDFRGCGDSGGDYHQFTVFDEVADTYKAIDCLSGQLGVDRERIGILGFSLGGVVATYAAARTNKIKALSLWAPAVGLQKHAEKMTAQLGNGVSLRSIRNRYIDYHGTLIGRRFLQQLPQIDPLAEIERFHSPVLLIHGTEDETVPAEASTEYYNVLKKKNVSVEKHLVSGADHLFSAHKWQELIIRKTVKFFTNNL